MRNVAENGRSRYWIAGFRICLPVGEHPSPSSNYLHEYFCRSLCLLVSFTLFSIGELGWCLIGTSDFVHAFFPPRRRGRHYRVQQVILVSSWIADLLMPHRLRRPEAIYKGKSQTFMVRCDRLLPTEAKNSSSPWRGSSSFGSSPSLLWSLSSGWAPIR